MKKNTTTTTQKLVNALFTKKRALTTKQLQSMGATNPSASIWYLRTLGYNVVTTSVKGVTKYMAA